MSEITEEQAKELTEGGDLYGPNQDAKYERRTAANLARHGIHRVPASPGPVQRVLGDAIKIDKTMPNSEITVPCTKLCATARLSPR
jgi:hypothetical protein